MIGTNPDLTRTELMIVLEYLSRFTDENNPAFQSKIIDYGKKYYNHEIRRQRIPEILDYLFRNSNGTLNWPFSVARVSTGERYKYYIDRRTFKSDELKTIIDSLIDDKYLDEEASNKLIAKLLETHTSVEEAKKLISTEHQKTLAPFKHSKEVLVRYETIVAAIKNKSIITFELLTNNTINYYKDPNRLIEDELFPKSGRVRKRGYQGRFYVYKVVEFNNTFYAMCGNISERELVTVPLDEVLIVSVEESYGLAPEFHELIDNFAYASLEDYLKDVLIPTGNYPLDIVFTFINSLHGTTIERLSTIYRRFFGQEMEYTLSELKQIQRGTSPDGTPRFANRHYVVTVAVRMGINSFLEFVQHPKVIEEVTIISPTILNKKLYKIYSRLAHRLEALVPEE